MNNKELKAFKKRVAGYIDLRRLREAMSEIKSLAHTTMAWEVEDKVKLAEQNYRLMLQYLTQGMIDPERNDVYDSLVDEIYSLLDSLVSYIESIDNPSLYFSTLRTDKVRASADTLDRLWQNYRQLADKLSIVTMVDEHTTDGEAFATRSQLETVQSRIFRRIWTSPLIKGDQAAVIKAMLTDAVSTATLKELVVSALTLALMEQYDSRKLELLMEVYHGDTDVKLSSAALVGMLLSLWRYSSRPLTRRLTDRLNAIKETPGWSEDLSIAFIELIRARDTERVNRKMQDELLPNMQKLRPDIIDKINDGTIRPDDPASLQENPEWEEMLNKSGVADQLKELTEMQMEGSDVMMSTFSHLKGFSFFNEIANWFLPFDADHTEIARLVSDFGPVAELFSKGAMLCDSDKYSFILSLTGMPEAMKTNMVNTFKNQLDGIVEQMGADLDNNTARENRRICVNLYIQNIYRFFKLYPRRNEFFDPFDTGVNLIAVPALADEFSDADMLQMVAEFYFKLKYMVEALEVFGRLEQLGPGDAARYQKMGYCHERLHHYDKAIDYYERADLLDVDSAWTVRRLAACYRAVGNKAQAGYYYSRLADMQPDNLKSAMLYGQSLVETGDYAEAIRQFYKVEFLDEKNTSVWRPLAWTLFLTGDFEGAQRYYDKIVLDAPTSTDYLNMGHVSLATGNIRDAVNNYALSIQAAHNDKEWFIKALSADKDSLQSVGVDLSVLPLIVDAALYMIK